MSGLRTVSSEHVHARACQARTLRVSHRSQEWVDPFVGRRIDTNHIQLVLTQAQSHRDCLLKEDRGRQPGGDQHFLKPRIESVGRRIQRLEHELHPQLQLSRRRSSGMRHIPPFLQVFRRFRIDQNCRDLQPQLQVRWPITHFSARFLLKNVFA